MASTREEEKVHEMEAFDSAADFAALSSSPTGKFTMDDGTVLMGHSFGAERSVSGEVVFNTGMVGYPEALTDPSYRGQIVVLTYPLIGNYGVPDMEVRGEDGLPMFFESDSIHITGLIVTDYAASPSHYQHFQTLGAWLKSQNIPALFGVDTRALTKKLRVKGAMLGKFEFNGEFIPFADPNMRNLVAEVSRKQVATYGKGEKTIIAVDCGMKHNIIRHLISKGVKVKVVPWDYDFTEEEYDGLFISNGPGDPTMAAKTVDYLRKVIAREPAKPIFGICLGNQLLALAAGAKTRKMKFGNRGMNQPCIDLRTTRCYITPQNHGYEVDESTLPADWSPMFRNANDYSNEGIIHRFKPFFSVQFHPEAMGGPTDTSFLFDMFLEKVFNGFSPITLVSMPPPLPLIKRVLLLGSGGLSIGQAGEFDYSGSQAIKALKEENIFVILINPNIATVQTSSDMADRVYLLPLTTHFVTDIIKKERPDGILLQFGGQTALNVGIELYDSGVLEQYGVTVLGTPVPTIVATEDRKIFAEKLAEINESIAPSFIATTVDEAMQAAKKLGFPVLVRAGFALGGLGSGFAADDASFKELVTKAFSSSSQVIIDKSLKGWKELEYEVVRDNKDNCITVCNMENLDPLGIHTGDSIVVAPSQTLSNAEYFMLRAVALKVVRHLGVVGECNIQYAVDPVSNQYTIIEVNARLSRSSALASKATGYPLAYVAAKLSLGKSLTDVKNSITKVTTACFEPALDYCVVKIPRWDMRKFSYVSSLIGSSMKSVGEVMAIGRTFEETFQKAIRMMDDSMDGFGKAPAERIELHNAWTKEALEHELENPSDIRIFAVGVALRRGYTVERLHQLTRIDRWFLGKLQNIAKIDAALCWLAETSVPSSVSGGANGAASSPAGPASPLPAPAEGSALSKISAVAMRNIKANGFSDRQIARLIGSEEIAVRTYRKSLGVLPFVKQIDTLAAEFPAQTNYLYMTYNADEHDITFGDKGIMVLGCGAYRIGSSCEFDWCAVSCIRTLRKNGFSSIMVNYNPETVSTDYDECDRLYFEELSLERVLDIYESETSSGVVVSVGGQIPNTLALKLHRNHARIIGTSPEDIDRAEDRHKFSSLLDAIHVDQPPWNALTTLEDAKAFAANVGYPCLVRPSYVLSGAAMSVCHREEDLENFLGKAVLIGKDQPVVISKFIQNAKEIEYDGVAAAGQIVNYAISEHVENAGVHSGDATLMLPAQKLYVETIKRIKKIAASIALALKVTGPFNIQFLSRDNSIRVIECNLRASRSFPFVSKTMNLNFIELATKVMVGLPYRAGRIDLTDIDHVCVKCPMFSFTRLQGADPRLRVEMASTGEVACFGRTRQEAFLKAVMASGLKLPRKNVLIAAGADADRLALLGSCQLLLAMGFQLFGTEGTSRYLQTHKLPITMLHKPSSGKEPSVQTALRNGDIHLAIAIPNSEESGQRDGYHIRRTAVDFSIPLISNIKLAILFIDALYHFTQAHPKVTLDQLPEAVGQFMTVPWDEYMRHSKLLE